MMKSDGLIIYSAVSITLLTADYYRRNNSFPLAGIAFWGVVLSGLWLIYRSKR